MGGGSRGAQGTLGGLRVGGVHGWGRKSTRSKRWLGKGECKEQELVGDVVVRGSTYMEYKMEKGVQ